MTATNENPPISAYIRTLNEERMIGDVVRAALCVAREVVVVDSGSADNTIPTAKAAGAKIIEHTWLGNGHQKRFAEDHCAHHWMLDLDADEIITKALAEEIKTLFEHGAPSCAAYRTNLALAPPVGAPWRAFGLATRHKLYDKHRIRPPAHQACDQFEITADLKTGTLNEPLLHYAFTGIEQYLTKLNRNSSVRAKALPLKSKPYLAVRILFGLPIYFLKVYILRQYFRGGIYGFGLALASGIGRWLRDIKMWARHHQQ